MVTFHKTSMSFVFQAPEGVIMLGQWQDVRLTVILYKP